MTPQQSKNRYSPFVVPDTQPGKFDGVGVGVVVLVGVTEGLPKLRVSDGDGVVVGVTVGDKPGVVVGEGVVVGFGVFDGVRVGVTVCDGVAETALPLIQIP